jgi:hypothetical protein
MMMSAALQGKRIGILSLARPTFDVPFAQEMAARAFAMLDATGATMLGPRDLLFDAQATQAALETMRHEALDLVLILQVTFTDASMTVAIAEALQAPLALWAFPEPRAGGRLRLNGFCGINLAAHALGRAGRAFATLYGGPDQVGIVPDLAAIMAGRIDTTVAPEAHFVVSDLDQVRAEHSLAALKGSRIGLVGEHPAGFDTCRYEPEALHDLVQTRVEPITLPDLFNMARAIPADAVAVTREQLGRTILGLDEVDQAQLDCSIRVYHALDEARREKGLEAMAVRCWPEMFTEYGCAACGPMGLLTQAKVPCACEADVYGALTGLMLQTLADAPAYLVDMVDIDPASDTAVVWHCGSAPSAMADPDTPLMAQIHSNRKMPLLQEFALKPGRVTVARLSQSKNRTSLFIGGATMLKAPKSFTGTSGVLRFDTQADTVMRRMMGEALEHHVALVYGEHRAALFALGQALGLCVKELG